MRWITAAVLASLLLAACGSSTVPRGAGARSPDTASSTVPLEEDGASDDAQVHGGEDPSSGGTEQQARSTARGTFGYSTVIDLGPDGQYQGSRTLSYYPPERSTMLVRQITKIHGSPQREWWFRFRLGPKGISRVTDYNPDGGLCTFDRPLLELPAALEVGDRWRSEAHCVETGQRWLLEARVDREETVTVEGQKLETLVIERELTRASPGADPPPLEETRWFSPEHGVDVRMRTQGGGSPLDLVDNILSLEPDKLPQAKPPSGV